MNTLTDEAIGKIADAITLLNDHRWALDDALTNDPELQQEGQQAYAHEMGRLECAMEVLRSVAENLE